MQRLVTLCLWIVAALSVGACTEPEAGRDAAEPPNPDRSATLDQVPAAESGEASEPLLLLDEAPADAAEADPAHESGADNSRCHVCHINYETEELAGSHARAGMGCADCHGASDAHIADESWASGGNGTAPDIFYTLEQVNPACMKCHPRETLDAAEHAKVLAGAGEKSHCTDCHGDHRLPRRRCKWK